MCFLSLESIALLVRIVASYQSTSPRLVAPFTHRFSLKTQHVSQQTHLYSRIVWPRQEHIELDENNCLLSSRLLFSPQKNNLRIIHFGDLAQGFQAECKPLVCSVHQSPCFTEEAYEQDSVPTGGSLLFSCPLNIEKRMDISWLVMATYEHIGQLMTKANHLRLSIN